MVIVCPSKIAFNICVDGLDVEITVEWILFRLVLANDIVFIEVLA